MVIPLMLFINLIFALIMIFSVFLILCRNESIRKQLLHEPVFCFAVSSSRLQSKL